MLQLKKFRDIPVTTREEARESHPHPEEPGFRLIAEEEESVPCVVGKEFPAIPTHLKRRCFPLERREELQVRATISRVSQVSQSISGKTFFPALPRISSRGSTHTTVALGIALLESFVGNPRGKASRESLEGKPQTPLSTRREARHCCYSSGVKSTCMPPLETRTDSPGETPEIPQDPCQHWRGILRFRHRLHARS